MASPTASSSRARYAAAAAVVAALLGIVLPGRSGAATPPFSACLVTGGLNLEGPAFDRLATAGLRAAGRPVARTRVVRGSSQAQVVRGLRSCAEERTGITIGVGYGMATAVDQVATAFPHAAFAIVGVDVRTLRHRPANVEGLLFRDEQAGYLAGYAAGLWAKEHGGAAVGSVGALDIPPIEQAVAGFQFGAKRAYPGIKTLNGYSDSFSAPAACEKRALAQIEDGAVVEFQVAGACGLGVLAAAHAKGILGIGFGTDQSSRGSFVLTSALERVDVVVEAAIRAARAGSLVGGSNVSFGARDGGIGFGAWSPRASAALRRAVAAQYALLRAGKITGIPTTVQ